ncbi:MAG TPA: M42 family metallopeptidase [bacterium]|nr:M42 family metallopeptidase [bacterium]HOM26073.1 M42 family metallopeptidase [bacterium]
MESKAKEFLKRLVETPSPSGFERIVQNLVKDYLKNFIDRIEIDIHGNLIAIKNPSGIPKIMLGAHCDEVGFQVKYISEEGFIFFQTIGAPYIHSLHGQKVIILNKKRCVKGVICKKKIDKAEDLKINSFWIDIGAKNKEEAEKFVSIGDPIAFSSSFTELLEGKNIMAKGFDDKIGVFVIAETMRLLSKEKIKSSVYGVSTVQEEIGSRGAWMASFKIKPDIAIVVEVMECSDYPDTEKRIMGDIRLGKGPVLQIGPNITPTLGEFLIETAKKEKIPYQIDAAAGPTPTDASVIQIIQGGIATALLRIPLRYMHTSGEIVSQDDVKNAIKLLTLSIKNMF